MVPFTPRKIKFKAWNNSSRLLMRLNSIDCNKGELVKKDHVLLQFTGLLDKAGNEIYDMDILLISSDKFIVFWNPEYNGWYVELLERFNDQLSGQPFLSAVAATMKRLGSYFELDSSS